MAVTYLCRYYRNHLGNRPEILPRLYTTCPITDYDHCDGVKFFLALAFAKTIPIGTAYAVWTGIGIMGTVILGIVLFHEPVTFMRLLFLSMILIGIVGLKLSQ